jgi:outer membrane protein assembly factor BamD
MFSRIVRWIVPAVAGLALVACASTPRHQGLTADQLWALGQREYDEGKLGDAAQTLETLLRTFPSFSAAADAQLLLARSYFDDEKYVTAQAEYRRFLDRHPAHPEAAGAALGMCRSAEALSPISQRDQSFTEQALQLCTEAALDYPGTPEADEAAAVVVVMREKLAKKTYETGSYYLRRSFHHSAILYFEIVLDEHPGTSFAPKALVGLMDAYEGLGYDDEVAAARERLLDRYPDSPEARRVAEGGAGDVLTRSGT